MDVTPKKEEKESLADDIIEGVVDTVVEVGIIEMIAAVIGEAIESIGSSDD